MVIDVDQYVEIVEVAFAGIDPALRDAYSTTSLPAEDAALIVAIAQAAVPANEIDRDKTQQYIEALARHVYRHAKLAAHPPLGSSIADEAQRAADLRTRAARLVGKPSASLAFALSHILVVGAHEDTPGAALQQLGDVLGIDDDRSFELVESILDILANDD